MSKFCSKCGNPRKDGANFCATCGNSFAQQAQVPKIPEILNIRLKFLASQIDRSHREFFAIRIPQDELTEEEKRLNLVKIKHQEAKKIRGYIENSVLMQFSRQPKQLGSDHALKLFETFSGMPEEEFAQLNEVDLESLSVSFPYATLLTMQNPQVYAQIYPLVAELISHPRANQRVVQNCSLFLAFVSYKAPAHIQNAVAALDMLPTILGNPEKSNPINMVILQAAHFLVDIRNYISGIPGDMLASFDTAFALEQELGYDKLMYIFEAFSVFHEPRSNEFYQTLLKKIPEIYEKLDEAMKVLKRHDFPDLKSAVGAIQSGMIDVAKHFKDEESLALIHAFSARHNMLF